MKAVVAISTVLCLAMVAQAAIVDNFDSYTGSSVIGQGGWTGAGWGLLSDSSWGSNYLINGTKSMYTGNSSAVRKAWAGSGAVFADKTNVSFLSRLEINGPGVNDYWVTLANTAGGGGLTVSFYDKGGSEQIKAYYNNGSGWDFYATTLPGWGGNHKTYKLEYDVDFVAKTVTLYGTPNGGTRSAGFTLPYDLGTAPDMLANGSLIVGAGGGGNITMDDIDVTPVPEPVTLTLLGLGACLLRRK